MVQKRLVDYSSNLEPLDIAEIPIDSPKYPIMLRQIKDPPKTLYALGNIELLNLPAIAIVGTRKPSNLGKKYAEWATKFYAQQGFVIVSGLALGIDSIVTRTALDVGANLISVLPSPVDSIVPKKNEELAKEVVKKGGLLISELPLGTKVRKHHFIRRNRIISGISLGVVIVEADLTSGTMHTVKFAQQQRRILLVADVPASGNEKLKNDGFPIIRLKKSLNEKKAVSSDLSH
ncbi:DNA-processing protein DprA [Thermococcus eurythermalis]|uniref:DNA-processing protein DprA n=1 Tax=Thermococcus eurythermalis TaxID=1505907 RepID=UPI000678AD35|nr:DNA-processing protein DprA [Thermococcus eurythermalis]